MERCSQGVTLLWRKGISLSGIYSLYANRVFNNGKTTIKEITHFFEEALGVKLGNTSLRFQEILRRKDSIAFLDQLRDSLENYMTRIDDKTRT